MLSFDFLHVISPLGSVFVASQLVVLAICLWNTEFYRVLSFESNGKYVHNVFDQTDEAEHSRQKKPVAKFYSLNNILGLEPYVEKTMNRLCHELEKRFIDTSIGNGVCDLGDWLTLYCWDVVGEVTFGQPHGYLDRGSDFDGAIAVAGKIIDYLSIVGQMPTLDFLLDKNPILKLLWPSSQDIISKTLNKRLLDRYAGKDKQLHDLSHHDLLDNYIQAKESHPEIVDDTQIKLYITVNILAGADTIAITLRAIFYYALKHPSVFEKLEQEIIAAGVPPEKPFSFHDARKLPYLDAVIREAMRIHPAVPMILERYVPQEGLHLPDGRFIPSGSITGMTPYIIHRNQSLFGDDADQFKPERWLQGDQETTEKYRERRRLMDNADLTFGGGSRVCLGKHIAILEIFKTTATIVNKYNIELTEPHRDWKLRARFFFLREEINVKLSPTLPIGVIEIKRMLQYRPVLSIFTRAPNASLRLRQKPVAIALSGSAPESSVPLPPENTVSDPGYAEQPRPSTSLGHSEVVLLLIQNFPPLALIGVPKNDVNSLGNFLETGAKWPRRRWPISPKDRSDGN
ncbi:hypothetical protein AAE478_000048 [Parahypoxylon ruwenzoriense]